MTPEERNAVIEECARIAKGWAENNAYYLNRTQIETAETIANEIRALKSQPSTPDKRDEALRLARDALRECASKLESQVVRNPKLPPYYKVVVKEAFKALAVIDEVLEGKE